MAVMTRQRWRRALLVVGWCEVAVTIAICAMTGGGWLPVAVAFGNLVAVCVLADERIEMAIQEATTNVVGVVGASRMIVYSLDPGGHVVLVMGTLRVAVALVGTWVCSQVLMNIWFDHGRRHGGSVPPDSAVPLRSVGTSKSE